MRCHRPRCGGRLVRTDSLARVASGIPFPSSVYSCDRCEEGKYFLFPADIQGELRCFLGTEDVSRIDSGFDGFSNFLQILRAGMNGVGVFACDIFPTVVGEAKKEIILGCAGLACCTPNCPNVSFIITTNLSWERPGIEPKRLLVCRSCKVGLYQFFHSEAGTVFVPKPHVVLLPPQVPVDELVLAMDERADFSLSVH